MEECYACMVGVWTGPESHDPDCSYRATQPVVHTVRRSGDDERAYWECSCGRAGSCCAITQDVDAALSGHIDFESGERLTFSSLSLDEPWTRA
jgi:hypothetical protein